MERNPKLAYKVQVESRKILETFELQDQYQLSGSELLGEASKAAHRLAEIHGWRDILVQKSQKQSILNAPFMLHYFDILGAFGGENQKSLEDASSHEGDEPFRKVAQESPTNP